MRFIILFFSSLLTITVAAQTESDALRFSRLDRNGGARNIGVMGSLGALGADFGVLSTNPAGLASFRRSELFFSLGMYHKETDARLLGGENEIATDALNRFHFQNGGLVVAHEPKRGKWKTVNVGIGITQLANYRQKMFYEGFAEGTITDRFSELANGLTVSQLDNFEAGLAWDAGAIYDFDGDRFYETDFFNEAEGQSKHVKKIQAIDRRGYMNELQLGFAGNYDDKLYAGINIGVPILSYEEHKIYQEQDISDSIVFFNHLRWEEELASSGTGINLRLGLIYRINQMFRIGGAIHTPTAFAITDEYSKTLTYNFTEDINEPPTNLEATSPEGTFDYRLYTPWRLFGNAGVIIGKAGFISGEVEWVDYSTASFNFTPDVSNPEFREAERQVNLRIAESFQDALHIRLGAEATYKIFRFRGGIGFSGTEYANEDMWSHSWSAGLGIREDNFYIDLGFRRQILEEGFIPYETSAAPELNINTRLVQDLFALTFGIKL